MLLEVRNLTKVYKRGNQQIKANDNINFFVERGDVLGILGPNGAGKTTLIKQIATLLIHDQGDILYKGVSLLKSLR
ncbi:ATP-binding cassette domain-containing protein [Thermoanaerobacter sp. RKWS2]|uniref:ATP-binding cassette domain-containing protein n=1 Tax=Thermoanaerobacter sp. RKWS2 TaxID=2983842 RepID=UPI00224B3422|nr:ATP-binding cassette domain-containing protein [Thermoanaerobacter sp. RKWS2]UZQ83936.1 ATP-binding cassette domain-containing protein [Thermoanaerobacter sp. RKWS2]